MLDPQARALIDLMAERKLPPMHTLTPQDARRVYLERRSFSQPQAPEVGDVRNLRSDSGLALRLYKPVAAPTSGLPVLLYLHGGGWTIGDLDTHDVLCRELCALAGIAVLAVDYRLGPEHVFPAAVDDCLETAHWLRREATALGLDGTRIAVGGDSAGGALAATVSLLLRDAGEPLPLLQLLIYPATDMRLLAPSHTTNGQGYVLTSDTVRYYRQQYTPDEAMWSDWRASPLLAPDLAGLPPALVLTAGYDPLHDEGRQYADALSAAGNRVQSVCFDRQIHGFILMGKVLDEAHTAVALCAAVLRRALHPATQHPATHPAA